MYEGSEVRIVLARKSEGKRSLGEPRPTWKRTNVKIDLGEAGLEETDWINLAEERDRWQHLVNTIMNIHVV
jgi:hypothetical protein